MKKLIILFLLVPMFLSAYVYTIPYGDTPQVTKTEQGAPLAVTTEDDDRVVAIDNFCYLIQEGHCWYAENVYPIPLDATVDIVFDATDMTERLIFYPSIWATSSGPVKISLGTCTSYTGGTEIDTNNRKPGTETQEVDLLFDATITGGVFPTYPTILVGTDSTNQSSGGGVSRGSLPIIRDNDTIYVYRIVNEAGVAIDLYSDIIWFEVD